MSETTLGQLRCPDTLKCWSLHIASYAREEDAARKCWNWNKMQPFIHVRRKLLQFAALSAVSPSILSVSPPQSTLLPPTVDHQDKTEAAQKGAVRI